MSNSNDFPTSRTNQVSTSKPNISEQPPISPILIPAPPLASSRYNRQLLLPQLRLRGQEHLLTSKVLIIGLGGLGSPAALYLAGAGVGTLGLLDGDTVEISNLHRQIVHTEAAATAGVSKVRSAAMRCRELNSTIDYVCHEEAASASNILDMVVQYDLVLDCTDNPATRYLISDACVILGKVLVSGAAQRGEGMLIVLNSPPMSSDREEKGPCYRCVFPRPPAPETVRGCSEIGILGPVVGMIGTMMAGEAIKIILKGGHLPVPSEQHSNGTVPSTGSQQKKHTMLLYNTFASDPRSTFRTITLRGRRKDCLTCGDDDVLANKGLSRITADVISQSHLDYQAFCGVLEDVNVLGEENRISAAEFLEKYAQVRRGQQSGKRKRRHVVVDVREEHEFELGAKVAGSVNVPLSRILRNGGGAFDGLGLGAEDEAGMSVKGGMNDGESLIGKKPLNLQDKKCATENAGPEQVSGRTDRQAYIPIRRSEDSRQTASTTHGSELGPDGGRINQESHNPVTEQSGFPSPSTRDIAVQTTTIGPHNGILDQEPDTSADQFQPQAHSSPDGGYLDEESHIPITGQNTFSSTDFPARPGAEVTVEEDSDKDTASRVYFVCQRGNDSQIAAQELMESLGREEGADEGNRMRKKWSWIGDVKGGFLAMERHVAI